MLTSKDFESVIALEGTEKYTKKHTQLMRMIGEDVVFLMLQNKLPLGKDGLLSFIHPARAKIFIFESDDNIASTCYGVTAFWQDNVFRGRFLLRDAKLAEVLDSYIEDCFR